MTYRLPYNFNRADETISVEVAFGTEPVYPFAPYIVSTTHDGRPVLLSGDEEKDLVEWLWREAEKAD